MYTYEHRSRIGRTTEVRYHELFAAEFVRREAAYFSDNTRHAKLDKNAAPTFDRPDNFRLILKPRLRQILAAVRRF